MESNVIPLCLSIDRIFKHIDISNDVLSMLYVTV